MCGIAGAFDLSGERRFPAACLQGMLTALEHRGPDGVGVHRGPGVALGVRRLALVDVEGGQQPFQDMNGTLTVVVNGELFAHADERRRLESRGARFRSRCDAEVWAHGLAIDGESFISRAQGQFAIAATDARAGTLTLARDRFGICPLFVAEADGWLLFASEAKALLASGLVTPALDRRAVDHVFALLCTSPARSSFLGVTPLPPGHALVVARGQRPSSRRVTPWPLSRAAEGDDVTGAGDTSDATPAALLGVLEGAVARRLDADVPLAVALSGGVDSSLVLALAARQSSSSTAPLTAFSVALDGVGTNEAALAARTVEQLSRGRALKHEVVRMDRAAIVAELPAVVRAAESPIVDHADACLSALYRAVAARGFKGILTGEGADEAFVGYPWSTAFHGRGRGWQRALLALLAPAFGRDRLDARGSFAEGTASAWLLSTMARVRDSFYAEGFWQELGSWSPWHDHEPGPAMTDPLLRSQLADMRLNLAGHLLVDKGDRVAMAHSVECRYPFLDEAVVAFAARLPTSAKLRGGVDKWLLREAARLVLPDEVAGRQKHMFRADPVLHARPRPAFVEELLSEASLRRTGIFDPARVRRALFYRDHPLPIPKRPLLEFGLSLVTTTQLFIHLFMGGGLCALPPWSPPVLAEEAEAESALAAAARMTT